jgi:hypothetical protein
MRLYSPLDSLLGFEHAPRGAKQEEVARAMAATLRDPAKLFRANPEARCEPGKVDLSSPVLSAALLAGGGAPAARPAPASKDPGKKESHAGLDGSFEFACAQPGALRSLDATGMFAAFRRLGRIDVQLVTPRGQARRVLTRSSQSLSW